MIISRTPLRISLFGGGTDYPDHFKCYGGATIGMSINKYSYLIISSPPPFFDYKYHLSYRKTELTNSVEEIEHPSIRECLKKMNIECSLDIFYKGDLPARSGLGSSSSFTVGLLNSLHAMQGRTPSKFDLSSEAVFIEQKMIGERVGVQDQYLCACGGLNHLVIQKNGNIEVNEIGINNERFAKLKESLLLFYTGKQRYANDILEEQIKKTKNGENRNNLSLIADLTEEAKKILLGQGLLDHIGELLNLSWQYKKRLSNSISNPLIDKWYDIAITSGAIGGKLLGAGGGGFLLFYVPLRYQRRVINALEDLYLIDFEIDRTGSTILYRQ